MIQILILIGVLLLSIHLVSLAVFFWGWVKYFVTGREDLKLKSIKHTEMFEKNREAIKKGQQELELKRKEFNRKYKM